MMDELKDPAAQRRLRPSMALLLGAMLLPAALPVDAGSRTYKTVRADEDWSWLDAEPPETVDAFDGVKHAEISDTWHLTFGGSFRVRFENDWNRGLAGPPIFRDAVIKSKAALNLELGHEKDFRVYTEIRAAETFEAERAIPVFFHDDPDVHAFFVEGTFASETEHSVSIRGGRQEMLFGAQRLISPLDWWSTRRTFDGLQVIARTARTATSVFAMRPVGHDPHDVDKSLEEQAFWGVYSTFKPAPGHVLDAYALVLDDSRDLYLSESGPKGDLERDTFGMRYDYHGESGWLAETEGALQRGHFGDDDLSAWFGSATFGHEWKQARMKPKLTVGLDAASGDDDPSDGDRGTFDPMFPDGHAFLGSMDLVGRSNLKAARLEFVTFPATRFKWSTTLHRFWLFDDQDALYDAGGKAIRRDATGASGDDVGIELDMFFGYTFETHHWVGFEICRWWSGDFVKATGFGDDAWFAWLSYEFKF